MSRTVKSVHEDTRGREHVLEDSIIDAIVMFYRVLSMLLPERRNERRLAWLGRLKEQKHCHQKRFLVSKYPQNAFVVRGNCGPGFAPDPAGSS